MLLFLGQLKKINNIILNKNTPSPYMNMKSLVRLFSVIVIISATATSCVSNYVVSNNSNYKYPTTNELLATHTSTAKGPNATKADDKKLVTSATLVSDKNTSQSTDVNIYAETEKSYTKEAGNLITEAKTYLGTPYLYGGTTRRGIDCSSFVQHVFNAFNIYLPRTSILQSQEGTYVSKDELKKGDLIFFSQSPNSRISHVAIVESVSPTGEIFFIHASSSRGVTVSSLDSAYWQQRFRKGKRILDQDNPGNYQNNSQNEDASLVKISF